MARTNAITKSTRAKNSKKKKTKGRYSENFIEFRLPSSVDSIRKNISQCLTRGHGQGVGRQRGQTFEAESLQLPPINQNLLIYTNPSTERNLGVDKDRPRQHP